MVCLISYTLFPCKCAPSCSTFKLLYFSSRCFWMSYLMHTPSCTRVLGTSASIVNAKVHAKVSNERPIKTVTLRTRRKTGSGSSSLRSKDKGVLGKSVENGLSSVVEEKNKRRSRKSKEESREELGIKGTKEMGSIGAVVKIREILSSQEYNCEVGSERNSVAGGDAVVGEGGGRKRSKKNKASSPSKELRIGLEMCSKRGDVMGAIQLYDLAQREGIQLGQYHYAVLLYLCSSAAIGVVQPAKSGSAGARALNALDIAGGRASPNNLGLSESSGEVSNNVQTLTHIGEDSDGGEIDMNPTSGKVNGSEDNVDREIWVRDDLQKYALQRGFEIYEKMLSDKVQMNEATLTAIARMAMSMGNGDLAFDMVKQMKGLGIDPKLRSYGPALSAYCISGNIDKAFAVEKHMLENGVYPEEPELEALLRVSVEAAKADRVYYVLHKLRACTRKVSPSTAEVLVRWFESKTASRAGKMKWNKRFIKEAIENRGGGWHGQGWLGRGKWNLSCTSIGEDGLCRCCGEKLTIIDLDPIETENFAESVASIAITRERDSSFQNFQKWLEYYGPFDAVVDGANVGLFHSKKFFAPKVNAVVNAIRLKLPSNRRPLVVLHNKRITGNRILEKWKKVDALYATPTGSNDDWYWLYAAIKFKGLIVTNDEMRDHKFELLGDDFFPKWKERHQVRFSFSDAGPVLHMPPPYSVVIQESEEGNWHIPIAKDDDGPEADRTWLCIWRTSSKAGMKSSIASTSQDSQPMNRSIRQATPSTGAALNLNSEDLIRDNQENVSNITNILSASVSPDPHTVLAKIEAAEELGNCVIDFHI